MGFVNQGMGRAPRHAPAACWRKRARKPGHGMRPRSLSSGLWAAPCPSKTPPNRRPRSHTGSADPARAWQHSMRRGRSRACACTAGHHRRWGIPPRPENVCQTHNMHAPGGGDSRRQAAARRATPRTWATRSRQPWACNGLGLRPTLARQPAHAPISSQGSIRALALIFRRQPPDTASTHLPSIAPITHFH
jgi:hypothetical protein